MATTNTTRKINLMGSGSVKPPSAPKYPPGVRALADGMLVPTKGPFMSARTHYTIGKNRRTDLKMMVETVMDNSGNTYHNWDHVSRMLSTYTYVFGTAPPDALFLAILFHDYVYIPGYSDNEAASAHAVAPVFYNSFKEKINPQLDTMVSILIARTHIKEHIADQHLHWEQLRHVAGKESPMDKALRLMHERLVDLDLQSLSSRWERFLDLQEDVQEEFAWQQKLPTDYTSQQNAMRFFLSLMHKGFVFYSPEFREENEIAMRNMKAYIMLVAESKFANLNAFQYTDTSRDILAADFDGRIQLLAPSLDKQPSEQSKLQFKQNWFTAFAQGTMPKPKTKKAK